MVQTNDVIWPRDGPFFYSFRKMVGFFSSFLLLIDFIMVTILTLILIFTWMTVDATTTVQKPKSQVGSSTTKATTSTMVPLLLNKIKPKTMKVWQKGGIRRMLANVEYLTKHCALKQIQQQTAILKEVAQRLFLSRCLHRFHFVSICNHSTSFFIWEQQGASRMWKSIMEPIGNQLKNTFQRLDRCVVNADSH